MARMAGRMCFVLTFPEQVVLLLLDDDEGIFRTVGKTALDLALTGSVLMELAFAHRIDTDTQHMTVIDNTMIGDASIDRVLERVADSRTPRSTRAWIETLSAQESSTIQEQTLARLVERGILKREERQLLQETVLHLWVFRSPRYAVIDKKAKHAVHARIAHVLSSDAIPNPADIALVCLTEACGVLTALLGGPEVARAKARVERLRKMDLIGREIAGAVFDVDRSITQSTAHPLS